MYLRHGHFPMLEPSLSCLALCSVDTRSGIEMCLCSAPVAPVCIVSTMLTSD